MVKGDLVTLKTRRKGGREQMKEGRGQRSNGREGIGREREGCIIVVINEHSRRDEVAMKVHMNTWSVKVS